MNTDPGDLRMQIASVAQAAVDAIVALGPRHSDIAPREFPSVRGQTARVSYDSVEGLHLGVVGRHGENTIQLTRAGDLAVIGTKAFGELAAALVKLHGEILMDDKLARQNVPTLVEKLRGDLAKSISA